VKKWLVGASTSLGLVQAASAATTEIPLYVDTQAPIPSSWSSPQSTYAYFRAEKDVTLRGFHVDATPPRVVPGSPESYFVWQLFQTNSAWQSPNGNNDRVVATDDFIDPGQAATGETTIISHAMDYFCGSTPDPRPCPTDFVLTAGSHYVLSLQISRLDGWIVPFYINESQQPFLTGGGALTVYGSDIFGPRPLREDALSLVIESKTGAVPEPETWGLMALGFACVGAIVRRSRKARMA
jgi:hypothetical protein